MSTVCASPSTDPRTKDQPDFGVFSRAVHARFVEMSKRELFVVRVPDAFERYLAAFPKGTNPVYRQRTFHDCQCCKQFVRRLGCLVNIVEGEIVTVWDDLDLPEPYKTVADAMNRLVRAMPIETVFRTKERQYGTEYNYDSQNNERHDHFWGKVADRHHAADPETKRGEQEAIYQVMRRGLIEIKPDDLETVLDLIESNGLYRGEEHKAAVIGFRDLSRRYLASTMSTFLWENLDDRNARFRNTVIGTLLTDLAEGKDLDQAVRSFEQKVAPMNYKRPTAVITQKMVEQALETLNQLDLGGAVYRRYARLSDVSVNDVLFVDNASRAKMKDGVAKLLEGSVKTTPPDLKKATRVSVDDFVRDVLPTAKSIELFLENRHVGNFVSLTGGDGPERLFKWNNNFAWSYDGDVTDSVKQRVKAAGGDVNAKLRVSLSWYNFDDLDLHAEVPGFGHVYYAQKQGILDVDMNAGGGRTRNAVENLAFNDLQRDGIYRIYVHQYQRRESIDVGFSIEVEFEGTIHQYSYPKMVSGSVPCFNLTIKDGRLVKIDVCPTLTGGSSSQEKWGVKTETLVPVAAVMNSPNHWGGQSVGARHLIFALDGCRNPEGTRGIYNEFLRSDLDKHRKVFEVLGAKTKCKPSDDQVSGVGFTQARGDSVTVVVNRLVASLGRRSYTISF